MLALSLPTAMWEAQHGFARPKREHGSRTPRLRTVHSTRKAGIMTFPLHVARDLW
jgi:hypothetical protein